MARVTEARNIGKKEDRLLFHLLLQQISYWTFLFVGRNPLIWKPTGQNTEHTALINLDSLENEALNQLRNFQSCETKLFMNKGKVFSCLNIIPLELMGGVKAILQIFLISKLEGHKFSASLSILFYLRSKNIQYRLVGGCVDHRLLLRTFLKLLSGNRTTVM